MKRDTYTLIRDGKRLLWYTERLWQLSKDLPVQRIPVTSIPEFTQNCWFQSRSPTPQEVAGHAKQIFDADLSYPVILNDVGGLMDGGHRLSKAYLQGEQEVLAVQFTELPEPDDVVPGDFVDLQTDRLRLREFVSHDLEALFDLYERPETSAYESWQPHQQIEDSLGLLQFFIDESYHVPRTQYVLAVAFEQQFVGLCGLELGFGTETDDLRSAFLSYRIHPEHWGNGLATEAAVAVKDFAFNTLGLHRVHAGCHVENHASIKVLEKVGLSREGTTRRSFPTSAGWVDYHLYGITQG